MADINEVIEDRLSGFAGLSALIAQRIYAGRTPQSPTLPYVTYQGVGGDNEQFLGESTGIARPRIQVDSWGRTHASARAVWAQVVAALHQWRDGTTSPRVIDSAKEGEPLDLYENDVNIHRVSQDFQVWYVA